MTKNDDTDRDVALQAWAMLLHVHARLTRAIGETVEAAGFLPLEWYDVLLALNLTPERRLRLSDLADRVVLSRSGLTRLVDRIEAAGLLRRDRCPDDRRGAYAVLTDAGRKALADSWPTYREQIGSRFAAHLTPEQALAMRDGLTRVLEAIEGGSRQPLVPIRVKGPKTRYQP